MKPSNNFKISQKETRDLLSTLKERFHKNMARHKNLEWSKIQKKLEEKVEKLWSLNEMEKTGGEPDVIDYDSKTDEYIFYDCSIQSPINRRSFCYDRQAQDSRKKHKPENNAMDLALSMQIEILSEEQYRALQRFGNFDTKTSSWIKTPSSIRKLGGALFADFRYDNVFIYHNGAESYYASRGFRGLLRI